MDPSEHITMHLYPQPELRLKSGLRSHYFQHWCLFYTRREDQNIGPDHYSVQVQDGVEV
jgi:hypothetical protein